MAAAALWIFDHSVGWLFDHTIGALVRRAQRPNRQRDDLDALAGALQRSVSAADNTRRGYPDEKQKQEARAASAEALAIAARIPDDRIIELSRGLSRTISGFMDGGEDRRAAIAETYEAALDRIHELRKRLT